MDKRAFIKNSFLAILGLTLPTRHGMTKDGKNAAPLPIVDTHVHLWNLQVMDYPWLEGADNPLARDFLVSDYQKATEEWPISKMVFVECARLPEQYLQEVDWVSLQANKDRRIKGMVAYFPLEKGMEAMPEMEELVSRKIVRGVRKSIMLDNPQFLEGLGLLEQFGLTYDLNAIPEQLDKALELVDQFPNLIFILNHLGNPDIKGGDWKVWSNQMKAFSNRENVNCKISGMITKADPEYWTKEDLSPYFDTVMETFGPERVVFGGDWPVVLRAGTYGDWMQVFIEMTETLSTEEKMNLYQKNAERIYRI